jgi:hypothetical protein
MFANRPEPSRISVREDAEGLLITIPAERRRTLILFLWGWFCGWVIGEVTGLVWLLLALIGIVAVSFGFGPVLLAKLAIPSAAGAIVQGLVVALIWLPCWTAAGAASLYAIAWHLKGREIIRLGDDSLTIHEQVGSHRRSRGFELGGVQNLRIAPADSPRLFPSPAKIWTNLVHLFGVAEGSVAFDHGGAMHRFGRNLSEMEVRRLLATIDERFDVASTSKPVGGGIHGLHGMTSANDQGGLSGTAQPQERRFPALSVTPTRLSPRIIATDDPFEGLRITIRAARLLSMILMFSAWTGLWAVFGVVIAIALFTGAPGKNAVASPVFLLVWLLFGLVGVGAWLWSCIGEEFVILSDQTLTIGRAIGPFKVQLQLGIQEVRDVRYSPFVYDPFGRAENRPFLYHYGIGGGCVAFEHAGRTRRIGDRLTESESGLLIDVLSRRVPNSNSNNVEPLPVSR